MSQRLEVLLRLPPEAAAEVLIEAIRYADDEERMELCRAAVATGIRAAVTAVVRVAPRLGVEGLDLLQDADKLAPAVAAAGPDRDPSVLATVIRLVGKAKDPALLRFVAPAVGDRDRAVAEAAGAALLATASARLGVTGRHRPDAADAERIDAAIAMAATRFRTHRLDSVRVAVALASARPGLALLRVFDDRDHPVLSALRGLSDRVDEPLVRWNLIRWLGNPVMARAAARALHRLHDATAYAETLVDGHLLLAPTRRRALRSAERPLRCVPTLPEAIKLPFRSQAWLPELALRLDLSARSRVGALADMIALPSPVARLKAVTALLTQAPDRVRASLEVYAHDRAGVVARLAMHGLVTSGPDEAGQLERLELAPHPAIAGRARRVLAGRHAEAFFDRWLRLSPPVRIAAGRQVLEAERNAFVAGLIRSLGAGGEAPFAAIMLIRRLQLENAVAPALCHAATASDARLASAAISALARVGTTDASRRLEAALDEEIRPRVRANAVEAIARRMARDAVDRLVPWIESPDNRVRANAVRALRRWEDCRAGAALERMLGDADPMHRVSGIWVAQTSRAVDHGPRLRAIALTDPHAEIRARARRAAASLETGRPTTIA